MSFDDVAGEPGVSAAAIDHADGAEPLYRLLPSLSEVLTQPAVLLLEKEYSRTMVVTALREVVASLRAEVGRGEHTRNSLEEAIEAIPARAASKVRESLRPSLVAVLNATGVLLHTNMGRAPLSEHALSRIAEVAHGYSNLELDLETGLRGRRDSHAGPLLLRLLAAKTNRTFDEVAAGWDVAIVNNCAAATFLALNTFAEGGEVLVSRGELVEIGGSFRVPDILRKSGALLREVGTTNKTRVADYETAFGPNTRLVLRVHQSNFKMEGFTERPAPKDLIAACRLQEIPFFEDQGTGALLRPESFGLPEDSSLLESFRLGADLIAASGDKLMGGPQCGILLGARRMIAEIRRNPLYRIFRVDKLTYAALEATLLDYLTHREDAIPLLRMLRAPADRLRSRCEELEQELRDLPLDCGVVRAESVIGGGTTPGTSLPGFAVSLSHHSASASVLLGALRRQTPALIGRIQDEQVLLDLRTISPEQDATVGTIVRAACIELGT